MQTVSKGRALRLLFSTSLTFLLAACGGGGGDSGKNSPPPPPPPLSMTFPAESIVKAQASADRHILLAQAPSAIGATGAPVRKILFTRASATVAEYRPPAGWSLLDFTVHPSGNLSAILATNKSLEIVRLDPAGAVIRREAFSDPDARSDPRIDEGGIFDPDSMLPLLSRDAARVAPLGEDLALVVRTGLNAVVAYRLHWTATGLERNWRALVEPGMTLMGRFLTSGSHDVFDQLIAHVRVHIATDDAGRIFIAVGGGTASNLFTAHAEHFQQAPIGAAHGAIVTQLSRSGERVHATVIDTGQASELHALRATPTGIAALGRVRTQVLADGSGWDGYAAFVSVNGAFEHYNVVNVDRGDILFDIAPAPQGGYLASGATGYTQNPAGASISEQAAPLLLSLSETGSVLARHIVAAGPRQNQIRAVSRAGAKWFIAGLANGAGTHSGDADPALITADGFLREISVAP